MLQKNPLLTESVNKTLQNFALSWENTPVLIAVSGGLDSVALAHYWHRQFPLAKIGWAHIHHGYREESHYEAQFVAQLSQQYKSDFFFRKLKLTEKPPGISLETWWRDQRYTFFNSIASQYGYSWVLTAHHLDDQVETLWMNLYRGTGLMGLQGIHVSRNLSPQVTLLRPFLGLQKSDIANFANSTFLKWMEDVSNENTVFLRNWIRKIWLPQQKSSYISAQNVTHLSREIIPQIQSYLKTFWNTKLPWKIEWTPQSLNSQDVFVLPEFEDLAIGFSLKNASLENSVYTEFLRQTEQLRQIAKLNPQDILEDSQGGNPKVQVETPQLTVLIKKNKVILEPTVLKYGESIRYGTLWVPFEAHCENKVMFSWECLDCTWTLSAWWIQEDFKFDGNYLQKDAVSELHSGISREILGFDQKKPKEISLRTWKLGEKWQPLGLHHGTKKIKTYFVEKLFTPREKQNWPLVEIHHKIAWVPFYQLSEGFKVNHPSQALLALEIKWQI